MTPEHTHLLIPTISAPFTVGDYPLTRVRSISVGAKVLAHVNQAFGDAEQLALKMAAADELHAVMLDVAALLPVAGRLHPDDLCALQTRVCTVLARVQS